MRIFSHIFVLAFAIWSFPLWAGTPTPVESASEGNTDVQPYSAEFSYSAASSVNIQFPGFALTADNGSLNKDLTIQI